MPSTRAAVSPSSSSTTRRTTTSRSAADRLRTAASSAGERPSPKTGSCRLRLVGRVRLLAPAAALLRAEVVERRAAGELAEPGARRGAPRVEAPPAAKRPLERLGGEVFCEVWVSGHVEQVAVDVVEVLLGHAGEAPFLRGWLRLLVGHEVGTALTLPLYAAGRSCVTSFARHSFDAVPAPTRHRFLGTVEDVLDSLPLRAGGFSPARSFSALVLLSAGGTSFMRGRLPRRLLLRPRSRSGPRPGPARRPCGRRRPPARAVPARPGLAGRRRGQARGRSDAACRSLARQPRGAARRRDPGRRSRRRLLPASRSAGAAAGGPVHLNIATLEQLDSLPGVGPVTAQKILDYRQKHGAFSSLDELDAIPGIGPARIEQLRDVAAP